MALDADLVPEIFIGCCYFLWIVIQGDFAVFEKDGAVAIFADVFHGVGDEDDGLLTLDAGKIVGAFLLEGSVADGKDFVEE